MIAARIGYTDIWRADWDRAKPRATCCGRHEDSELVAKALGRLTSEDREVIELKIFAGLTFREIADITSMPQGTVATLYRRALESLRPWLAKQLR